MDDNLEQNVDVLDESWPQQWVHVIYSIRLLTPDVANQKKELNCQLYAYADMLGTMFTIWFYKRVVLSPQVLIDNGINDVYDALNFLINRGIEKVRSYPAHRVVDPDQDPAPYLIPIPPEERIDEQHWPKRYTVADILQYHDQYVIRVVLSNNFNQRDQRGGQRGYRFPAVAIMRMGRFGLKRIARASARAGRYYHEERPANLTPKQAGDLYGVLHAMLIVGINTMSRLTSEHYVEVKNTWGESWGDGGFSKVAIDLLEYVYVPKMDERKYPRRI